MVGKIAATLLLVGGCLPLAAAPLFPEPLHLVRRIEDPIAATTFTVEQYCSGDRVFTISGPVVSIADYARDELTILNRAESTFSITPFEVLAKAARPEPGERLSLKQQRASAGGDSYSIRSEGDRLTSEVTIDRSVALSRDAVEVLIGAAHPNHKTSMQAAVLDAAAPAGNSKTFGLPARHTITYRLGKETLTLRSEIVRVTREEPPPDIYAIPPGARRIEQPAVALPRVLEDLDGIRR